MPIRYLYVLLGEMPVQGLRPFLNLVVWFFGVRRCESRDLGWWPLTGRPWQTCWPVRRPVVVSMVPLADLSSAMQSHCLRCPLALGDTSHRDLLGVELEAPLPVLLQEPYGFRSDVGVFNPLRVQPCVWCNEVAWFPFCFCTCLSSSPTPCTEVCSPPPRPRSV